MKNRATYNARKRKTATKAKSKRAPNPLRIDPTRTITLRKNFAAQLRRQFARLRFEVAKLIVDEDALGLVNRIDRTPAFLLNVFCSTGEGGGVDPSCSPSWKTGGVAFHGTTEAALKQILESGIRFGASGSANWSAGAYAKGEPVYAVRGFTKKIPDNLDELMTDKSIGIAMSYASQAASKSAKNVVGKSGFLESVPTTQPIVLILKVPKGAGFYKDTKGGSSRDHFINMTIPKDWIVGYMVLEPTEEKGIKQLTPSRIVSLVKNVVNVDYDIVYLAMVVSSRESIANAFCPTGQGGGVDPSCSPNMTPNEKDSLTYYQEAGHEAINDYLRGTSSRIGRGAGPNKAELDSIVADIDSAISKSLLKEDTRVYRGAKEFVAGDKGYQSVTTSIEVAKRFAEKFGGTVKSLVLSKGAKALKLAGGENELLLPRGFSIVANIFCPTGAGGGVNPSCSPEGSGSSAADTQATGTIARAKEALAKVMALPVLRQVKQAGDFLKATTTKLYKRLEARYGKSTAIACMASGQAVSWGAMGAGMATTGVPLVLPGSTLWGALPAVAVAETYLQAKRGASAVGKQADKVGKAIGERIVPSGAFTADFPEGGLIRHAAELGEGEIQRLAAEFMEELQREYLAYLRDNQGAIKAAYADSPTANDRWRFSSDPAKVKAFQEWLRQQFGINLIGLTEEQLWERYTEAGLKKGAGRAFDDVRAPERARAGATERLDFYEGTREEFLRSAFNRPVAIEKVQLLAGRSFDELKGVTSDMGLRMSRTLTSGLVQGKGPRDIARDLRDEIDIGETRALTIARTEIIRAHAEGQLMAMEDLGVEEVGVAVEWSTTGDERVCELCEPLEGVVLKLAEAKDMLPRHPNCRCAWIPAGVGEDKEDQKLTKGKIDKAIRISQERHGKGKDNEDDEPSWGPGRDIAKERPVGNELAFSEFVTRTET